MQLIEIDSAVVLSFIQGDGDAFTKIYQQYAKNVYKRFYFLLNDEDLVDELVHDLFIRLWKYRENIDPNKSFKNYIYTMLHNMAADAFKAKVRAQKMQLQMLHEVQMETESSEEIFVKKEVWQTLLQAIDKLPPQRKIIFNLCKIEEKSYEEVASLLNISTSTVSNQLVSAMKFIRIYMGKHYSRFDLIIIMLFFRCL